MRRFFVSILALLVAITAGTVFMVIAGLAVPETRDLAADLSLAPVMASLLGLAQGDSPDRVWSAVALTLWVLAIAVLCVPPLVLAVVGESGGFRSSAFYGAGTGLLAASIAVLGHPAGQHPGPSETKVMLLVFLSGAVSGLVYWALAGRNAGATKLNP